MDERWRQIREVFDSALRRTPNERRQFVVEACRGDQSLLAEVESLLSSLSSAEGFLENPALREDREDEGPVLEPGTRTGRYEIVKQIGQGGMGQVYLARDTDLGRNVAVKLLPTSITRDKNRVARFRQEAFATSALNHPNIVTIYEIWQWEDRDLIVTEYIEGTTLRKVLQKRKVSVAESIDMTVQTASALAAAHRAGIIHRDIKPENIMVRPDGLVKVLDFGIAKYRPSDDPKRAFVETEIGEVIGTAAYMSPEQARGQTIDARTDVWSLGVIFYEMLTGRLPFQGETRYDRIAAILTREPERITNDSDGGLSSQLQKVVDRALAKDKRRRYRDIAEMAENLHMLRETTGDRLTPRLILPRRRVGSGRAYLFTALPLTVLISGLIGLWIYSSVPKHSANPRNRSIAVLPLRSINAGNADELYSIGIADALIQRIGSIRGIAVRPLSAIRRYAADEKDPLEAGKEQQVDYVLAANYQVADGRIRVTAQLYNVAAGLVEETHKSDRDTSDLFAMQDAIAIDVGNMLLKRFASTSSGERPHRGTENEEAYRLYLQGMYLADTHTLSSAQKAVEVLEQAVEFDPGYAQAWAGKAYAHRAVANFIGRNASNREDFKRSMEAIERAVSLDENLAEAYSTLCENKMYYEYDFAAAESACKRGIELNPNSPLAHQVYSRYLTCRGRFDEAESEIRTAIDLEPASLFYNTLYGINFYYARRFPEAAAQFARVISMDENFSLPYYWLYVTLAAQGNESEAFESFMKWVAKADESIIRAYRAAYGTSGWRGVMQERARRFEQSDERYFGGAEYNAMAGNKDKAMEFLERSYERREMWMAYLQVDPRLDSLRGESRLAELIRRVEAAPAVHGGQ